MYKKQLLLVTLLIFSYAWVGLAGGVAGWLVSVKIFGNKIPVTNTKYVEKPITEEYDLLLVSSDEPRKIILVDFYKNLPDGLYKSFGEFHYFDGESWSNKAFYDDSFEFTELDGSNQLSASVSGRISVGDNKFSIWIPMIYTPMAIRAEKAYTKFGGATKGTAAVVTTNDSEVATYYAALLKGYNTSSEAIDIVDLGVNTDWFMFFDENWNFYHLDKTIVDKPHPTYTSHSFFAEILSGPSPARVNYFDSFNVTLKNLDLIVNYELENAHFWKLGESFKRAGYMDASTGYVLTSPEGGTGVYMNIRTRAK